MNPNFKGYAPCALILIVGTALSLFAAYRLDREAATPSRTEVASGPTVSGAPVAFGFEIGFGPAQQLRALEVIDE